MIDIDRFKPINDRHGHGVGDQVLRHVAGVLRQSLRPDSLIVRYGGDEFCALVSQRIPVTLSIGVTVHRPGKTLGQLLDEADRRAYRAKADGRNRVIADDLPVAG